ncbi:MAG: MoxR family ATPase [Lachnospiraceae bacterium]|nr:MoxR family ATPase [Lachnospiraceae bacterium]MBQ9607472.1 MoxR family ATPase [Lachnospiraceae bacterium]MBR1523173.1 MoxR family ATPase [Lachnospiraceae bacterium]
MTADLLDRFREQISRYFAGKKEITENFLCCFLASGHVLLEDVPGVGKTTLARTFAGSLGMSFGRIQFTPDTMPSDVTGLSIYDMKAGEFSYKPGAIMKNIILADELNRTSPKTQAALLEAMAESQVTIDGNIYPLPQPFMVIATQNPISFTGTFPLPEAQLDRFMMRLSIGYPSADEELRLAKSHMEGIQNEKIEAVLNASDMLNLKEAVNKVHISDGVLAYVHQITEATRTDNGFALGASPRAMLQLLQASRARAFLNGYDYVKPDDVKKLAAPVLSHRLVLTTEMKLQKKDASDLLEAIVLKTRLPIK